MSHDHQPSKPTTLNIVRDLRHLSRKGIKYLGNTFCNSDVFPHGSSSLKQSYLTSNRQKFRIINEHCPQNIKFNNESTIDTTKFQLQKMVQNDNIMYLRGFDMTTQTPIIVKLLKKKYINDPKGYCSCVNVIACGFSYHQHQVPLLNHGWQEDGDNYCMVFEFSGIDLGYTLFLNGHSADDKSLISIGTQGLTLLAHLSDMNLVLRDLTFSNMLVSNVDNKIKVFNFDHSKFMQDNQSTNSLFGSVTNKAYIMELSKYSVARGGDQLEYGKEVDTELLGSVICDASQDQETLELLHKNKTYNYSLNRMGDIVGNFKWFVSKLRENVKILNLNNNNNFKNINNNVNIARSILNNPNLSKLMREIENTHKYRLDNNIKRFANGYYQICNFYCGNENFVLNSRLLGYIKDQCAMINIFNKCDLWNNVNNQLKLININEMERDVRLVYQKYRKPFDHDLTQIKMILNLYQNCVKILISAIAFGRNIGYIESFKHTLFGIFIEYFAPLSIQTNDNKCYLKFAETLINTIISIKYNQSKDDTQEHLKIRVISRKSNYNDCNCSIRVFHDIIEYFLMELFSSAKADNNLVGRGHLFLLNLLKWCKKMYEANALNPNISHIADAILNAMLSVSNNAYNFKITNKLTNAFNYLIKNNIVSLKYQQILQNIIQPNNTSN